MVEALYLGDASALKVARAWTSGPRTVGGNGGAMPGWSIEESQDLSVEESRYL